MLELKNVTTYYGAIKILDRVNIKVDQGEIVCLLGGNAAGKTTTMRTIMGLIKPHEGIIEFNGYAINKLPTSARAAMGISIVPEGKKLFLQMSVLENLLMGAFLRSSSDEINQDIEKVFTLFPILKNRIRQLAASLSGGEQQMLAMARALMSKPRLLLMDEPTMGLAPALIKEVFSTIKRINLEGGTILMIEQNAIAALSIANRAYILQEGNIILEGKAESLLSNPGIGKLFLGFSSYYTHD